MTGRALGRLFVGLLMGTKIGIQAACGPDSKTEGSASLCAAASGRDIFDFCDLIHNVPSLSSCRQFQPSRTLLGLISRTVSKSNSPGVLTTKGLKPPALGSIISLDM